MTTTTTTAALSSKRPMVRPWLPSAARPAAFGVLVESWFRRARSTERMRAVAVAATHPIAAIAKGRKIRKSIATLENASLTPPATPAPGSRWSAVDRHDRDGPYKEHGQPGTDAGQPSGAPAHRGAPAAPRATHPDDQWHPDQQFRGGPSPSRIRADDARPREPGERQPRRRDEEPAHQPQTGHTGPAQLHAHGDAGNHHEGGQDHQHHPVPRVSGQPEVDEPEADYDRAAQRNGCQCCHRSDRPPWWEEHDAGHASESEAPTPRTTFDPVQLAEHRLAPLFPVGGEQPERPLQQPERHVVSHRLRVWRWVLATPQHHPCARQQQDREDRDPTPADQRQGRRDRGHYAPLRPRRRRGTDRPARATTSSVATYSRPVGVSRYR